MIVFDSVWIYKPQGAGGKANIKISINCYITLLFIVNFKWPCSSVVEQYPEKVCVVCAIQTKATTPNNVSLFSKVDKYK